MWLSVPRVSIAALVLFIVAACATVPASRGSLPWSGASPADASSGARKTISIALRGDINALTGDADQSGRNSPPSIYVQEFVNAYLTVRDQNDETRPQLAADLPSLDG